MEVPHKRMYTPNDALRWCLQIARGLKYLHASRPMVRMSSLPLNVTMHMDMLPRPRRSFTATSSQKTFSSLVRGVSSASHSHNKPIKGPRNARDAKISDFGLSVLVGFEEMRSKRLTTLTSMRHSSGHNISTTTLSTAASTYALHMRMLLQWTTLPRACTHGHTRVCVSR